MTATSPKHTYSIFINAPSPDVWAVLTDDAKTPLYQHYNMTSRTVWREGGDIEFFHAGRTVIVGKILAFEPSSRLAMTFSARWSPEVEADEPSTVTWTVDKAGPNASKVTVLHDGFARETATYKGVTEGWQETLSRLKTLVETGQELILAGYDQAAAA